MRRLCNCKQKCKTHMYAPVPINAPTASAKQTFTLNLLSHQSGVLTTFPQRYKIADRRVARCAVASNAVGALYNRIERHAAVFVFSILKINTAAWCLHGVLESALWKLCGNAVGSSRAPWAFCWRAACTL